jgi:hypothetical protein
MPAVPIPPAERLQTLQIAEHNIGVLLIGGVAIGADAVIVAQRPRTLAAFWSR